MSRKKLSVVGRRLGGLALRHSNTCANLVLVAGEIAVWWNGLWGRLAARRIYLRRTEAGFEVEARAGEESRFWALPAEELALALVEDLKAGVPGQQWRDMIDAYHLTAEHLRRHSASEAHGDEPGDPARDG